MALINPQGSREWTTSRRQTRPGAKLIIKPAFTVSRDNSTGSVTLGGGYRSPGRIGAHVGRVLLATPVILRDLGEVGHTETSQLFGDGSLALKRTDITLKPHMPTFTEHDMIALPSQMQKNKQACM